MSRLLLPLLLLACSMRAALPVLDVPPAKSAPVIDGDVSDDCWKNAATIPRLFPAKGRSDEIQETVVRVLWTSNFLYVAFDCVDNDVYTTGTMKHDDDLYKEDVVEIFLDGVGDGRQFIEIQIAPDGTHLDMMYVYSSAITNAADGRIETSIIQRDRWQFREWNMTGLETAACKTERGWSAEAAIPAASIVKRLGETEFKPGMEIRVQFVRYDHDPVEDDSETRRLIQQTWSPVVFGNPHNSPGLFGILKLNAE